MNESDFIVFLTDKYGKKNRTSEIESLSQSANGKVWNIKFINKENIYTYKNENVQLIENCLKDKNSATVFEYLMQMAQFSEIKNNKGENLLVKNLARTKFINKNSVLARYLNPQKIYKDFSPKIKSLIFPFGCNNRQLNAVKTALDNPISIIQGPPGTGKTQTILNIIANLLIAEKSVLVVSNNNDATANVLEKLSNSKYGMDFLCATLGRSKNVNEFLQNQKQSYPEYLKEWKNILPTLQPLIDDDVKKLEKYFTAKEHIAEIKKQLAQIELEAKHFEASNNSNEIYKTEKLANYSYKSIIELLQEVQFKYTEKEKLGFFFKWKLKIYYNIGDFKFWKTDAEKVLLTIKNVFYFITPKKLREELEKEEQILLYFSPENVYEKCLNNLKSKLAERYSTKEIKRYQSSKEFYFNMDEFIKEYPIIMSTTFSSRATIEGSDGFLFDYVIMDEASQVDVVTGAIAMSCCKNAVIVGDKKQLPNVIPEQQKTMIQKIFSDAQIEDGYNFLNSFLSSLEQVMPNTPQTLLREHYRCHPKIINFCNQQFYDGRLLTMTEDKGEENVLQAIKTIPGKYCTDHYNQRQIDVIKNEILPFYNESEKESLGIIAPYNNQTNAIKEQIPNIDTATVHKYQGREKDNIIISTVDDKITSFADDSNMLNVAISRAKKKLAVIISGNEQPENSNLMALLKYIEYNNCSVTESKVNSIFDFMFSKINQAKFEFLKQSNKISKFDSENAMNNLLNSIFRETQYNKFGAIFEMPLKDILSNKFIDKLPEELKNYANKSWSHVDFAIYNKVTKEILFGIEVDGYKYHKKGTVQAERDKKKNQFFEIIGIPLLRFSTKGSEEEKRITEMLNKFI